MAQSIKLKNNNYLDSTSVVHNKEQLNNVLNNFLKVGKTMVGYISYGHTYTTDILPLPIYFNTGIPGSDTYISIDENNHLVHIGKNVNYVKVTYNIRLDWDAPTDMTYYFALTHNGYIQWDSHSAIPKEHPSQYMISYSKLLAVQENDYIQLCGYASANITANTTAFIIVEVLG